MTLPPSRPSPAFPFLLWLLLLPGLLPLKASADDALMAEVHAFLYEKVASRGEEVVIDVRPPSAHLPPCETPRAFLTNPSQPVLGRVSVGVRCGPDGQQVRYLQAEVGVSGGYPVLRRDVAPGTLITPDLLEVRTGELSRLPRRSILDGETIVGLVAGRSLRAGTPLQSHQFHAPVLVERGQKVVIEAAGPSFRVTRQGEALEPGGEGDRVRVRIADRELITATVVGKARLAVDF